MFERMVQRMVQRVVQKVVNKVVERVIQRVVQRVFQRVVQRVVQGWNNELKAAISQEIATISVAIFRRVIRNNRSRLQK